MENNGSSVTEFILLGLSDDPNIKIFLFVLFLVTYMATVIGNGILITVCICEPRLHTPMYFFLVNLSFIDVCYSSTTVPNMLLQLIVRKSMAFSACAAQLYTFMLLACTECVLLAVMAYDRFVAISFPLRYTIIMNRSVCLAMTACCWLSGAVMGLLDTMFTLQLPLCGHNVINHFFCELNTLLKMACVDTFITETIIFFVGIVVLLSPTLVILISYIRIAVTIVGIRSAEGRQKAFSTCASHLIVVTMAYGTAIFMYMKPASQDSENQDKIMSLFNTVTPPLLHPMIYSLRNKDVKMAVRKIAKRRGLH